jgi:hypothetical protein
MVRVTRNHQTNFVAHILCNSVLLAQCMREKWLRHLTGDLTTFREDTNSNLVEYIMQMSIVPI